MSDWPIVSTTENQTVGIYKLINIIIFFSSVCICVATQTCGYTATWLHNYVVRFRLVNGQWLIVPTTANQLLTFTT